MDQRGKGCDQMDAAVVPYLRRQRRAPSAPCPRVQPRQLHADAGNAASGGAVVADQPAREADQDRREGCEPRPLRHLPNGRNRGATADVRRYPVADRPTAGTACASMSEQRDQMRQATSAKVCLDLAKSARFIVSALSTASFNRPLLALSTICRCPSRSKERSWPRNRGHLANVHLYHSSLRSDDVRVARNGESISFRDLSRSVANDSEGGLEALYQEYRSGSSIVLLFLHERWPPLKLLCQSLSSELSSRIQANMYLTPPQAQALKTHYDTHDVLVLQIHGKKRWRLFDRAVQLPLSHQRYTDDEDMSLGSPMIEVTLSPGDLMYLPRGYPHDAASADGASLHLTIGMLPITWASVLIRAAQSVIDANRNSGGLYLRDSRQTMVFMPRV